MRRHHHGHTHPCCECGAPVICAGEWARNTDGIPDVICLDYHLEGGEVADVRCADCAPERYLDFDPHQLAWPFARNH